MSMGGVFYPCSRECIIIIIIMVNMYFHSCTNTSKIKVILRSYLVAVQCMCRCLLADLYKIKVVSKSNPQT